MKGNINLMSSQVIIFILMASSLYYNASAFSPLAFGSRVGILDVPHSSQMLSRLIGKSILYLR